MSRVLKSCVIIATVLLIIGLMIADPMIRAQSNDSLRTVVGGLSNIALVDEVTPIPSVEGKGILFVDGDFYIKATPAVLQFVQSQALSGLPVVVVGPGFSDLCKSVGVSTTTKAQTRSDDLLTDAPIAAEALRVLPWRTPDGSQVYAMIHIIGDKSRPSAAVDEVAAWAERVGSLQSDEPVSSTKSNSAETTGLDATTMDAPYWAMVFQDTYSSGDSWKSHGKLNVVHTFYKLINDGSSNYDWMNIVLGMQTVPGTVAYGSSWRNSYTWVRSYVDALGFEQRLVDYGPTTTGGSSSTGVNIGVTAGENGAAVTAGMSWTYSTVDVQCQDSSDFGVNRFELGHDINETKNVGKYTYYHTPGLTVRLPNGTGTSMLFNYQAEYAKSRGWPWPWDHWWSPTYAIYYWGV